MSDQKPPAPGAQPGGGRRRSRRGGSGRSGNPASPGGANQQPRSPQTPRQVPPAALPGQPGGGGGRSRRRGRGGSGNRGGGGQQPQAPQRDAELSDQSALARLRELGFELEKVHELEAFIYFPNESNARRALAALHDAGYTTYPEPTGDGRWVVEAVIRAAPMPDYVAAMRQHLRAVAGPLGGIYDGWSAIPIDEEAEAEAARLAELEPPPKAQAQTESDQEPDVQKPDVQKFDVQKFDAQKPDVKDEIEKVAESGDPAVSQEPGADPEMEKPPARSSAEG